MLLRSEMLKGQLQMLINYWDNSRLFLLIYLDCIRFQRKAILQ